MVGNFVIYVFTVFPGLEPFRETIGPVVEDMTRKLQAQVVKIPGGFLRRLYHTLGFLCTVFPKFCHLRNIICLPILADVSIRTWGRIYFSLNIGH